MEGQGYPPSISGAASPTGGGGHLSPQNNKEHDTTETEAHDTLQRQMNTNPFLPGQNFTIERRPLVVPAIGNVHTQLAKV